MHLVLNSMSAWMIAAAFVMAAMPSMWTWRKRRRRAYSREFLDKLARSL